MPASSLTLHPTRAVAVLRERFEPQVERINILDKLDTFSLKSLTGDDIRKNTNQPKNVVAYLTLEELVIKHSLFYPTVRHALLIALTLPPITCTVERSLSTLRRVKT